MSAPAPQAGTSSVSATYDGLTAPALVERLQVPAVVLHDVVSSTMDVAHQHGASGAAAGTIVLADMQVSGRGRQGRAWRSEAGQGVWVTVIERPLDSSGAEVLSLRVGLALADALDALSPGAVRLKWPNDLHVEAGKLAGILIEARWRNGALDWVAIGVGLNVRRAPEAGAGALAAGVARLHALDRVVASVRSAAAMTGPLTAAELARFHSRDLAVGRAVVSPSPGIVAGIDAAGAVVIVGPQGPRAHRTGSLVFAEDA